MGDLQKATLMSVSANLQGLVKRHAKNGQPYTVEEFQKYYPSDWIQEWLDGPLEKKVSTDKKAYTASSFSRHFGTNWAAKYRTSDEATQVRLAKDGKPYTIAQFQSYYGNSWQTEFNAAPELACLEYAPTFKENYLKSKDLQKAMLVSVSANLQGLVKRY